MGQLKRSLLNNVKLMETITHEGKILAMVFSKNLSTDAISFLTPRELPLQVGLLQWKGGKQVPFHFHNHFKYNVTTTHEILYIEKGNMDVIITDFQWNELRKLELTAGDMILLMDGGHSVMCHDGSRIWEIKQGPYPGDELAKVWKTDHPSSFER